jgi:hypothetical protein
VQSAKNIGRVVGVLLPVQMAIGLILQFVLIQNALSETPLGFLQEAAANAPQLRIAIGLGLVGGALTLTIGILSWPVFRQYSQSLAITFVVICAISLVMDALQSASVASMLSLSERFVATENPNSDLFQAIGATVKSTRYWIHHVQLLFVGAWIFLFYLVMLRNQLVPSWLAALGILGIVLQFVGVTLPAFAGYANVGYLAMPLAPIHLLTGLWLGVRGFRERAMPV